MAQNNGVIDEHWKGGCYMAFWHEQLTDVYWPGDLTAQALFPSGLNVTSFNLHNHLSNHHTHSGVQLLTNHILIFCLLRWLKSVPSVATFHRDSQVAVILLKVSSGQWQVWHILCVESFGIILNLEICQTYFIYNFLILSERVVRETSNLNVG